MKAKIGESNISSRWALAHYAPIWIGVVILGVLAFFLFFHLGHYALWEDEANGALLAKGVLATGDTYAKIGENIVAWGGGATLCNMHDRLTPPATSYLIAASFALFGQSALTARLPFAVAGFLAVALILWWLWKEKANALVWFLMGIMILGNASYLLFARQGRYYGVAIFCCVALSYLYVNWNRAAWKFWMFLTLSLLLFCCHYPIFLSFYVALGVDYLVWGRYRFKASLAQWVAFIVVHVIFCGSVVAIWNPLATSFEGNHPSNGLWEKAYIIWWSFRDGSFCEFWPGYVLIAGLGIAVWKRDIFLIRGFCAFLVYIVFLSAVVTPQRITIGESITADVRYLTPLIPLTWFLSVRIIALLAGNIWWIAVPIGLLSAFSNILSAGTFSPFGVRSTSALFVGELLHPPSEPLSLVADWINKNVPTGSSVFIMPDQQIPSLIFHAPKAVYAWQFAYPPSKKEYNDLNPIHFKGQLPPDYIIIFGPTISSALPGLSAWSKSNGVDYQYLGMIDHFWLDRYRAEFFWRSFVPITQYRRDLEAIYLFKRVGIP